MTGPLRIGYYAHHVGSGHLHRATALAGELAARGHRVTGLSSTERPTAWPAARTGDDAGWVRLDPDDQPRPGPDADVTAHGRLHWAPRGHGGLCRRTAQLSAWLDATRPALLVADVSQEVAVLSRLHGVPVVSVLLPGSRSDPVHALGLGLSDAVVGFWPPQAGAMTAGLPADVARRVQPLGGQSRFAPVPGARPSSARHLVVLAGTGGGAADLLEAAAAATGALAGWTLEVLGGRRWVAEPFDRLRGAAVVLTHAGQNAVAEVAAARVPAVVVPQERPFDEQRTTAGVLADGGWPVVVADLDRRRSAADWAGLVERAAGLDGSRWDAWVDGGAAGRFADLVESVAEHGAPT